MLNVDIEIIIFYKFYYETELCRSATKLKTANVVVPTTSPSKSKLYIRDNIIRKKFRQFQMNILFEYLAESRKS